MAPLQRLLRHATAVAAVVLTTSMSAATASPLAAHNYDPTLRSHATPSQHLPVIHEPLAVPHNDEISGTETIEGASQIQPPAQIKRTGDDLDNDSPLDRIKIRGLVAARHIDFNRIAQEYMPLHRVSGNDVPPMLRRRAWQIEEDEAELAAREQNQDETGGNGRKNDHAPPANSRTGGTNAGPFGGGPAGGPGANPFGAGGAPGGPGGPGSLGGPGGPGGSGHGGGFSGGAKPPFSTQLPPPPATSTQPRPPAYTLPSSGLANVRDIYYLVNITINDQSVLVNLDTGSSDTWVVANNYQCVSSSGFPKNRRSCGFGKPFGGQLNDPLTDQTFHRFFSDGTFAMGSFAFADVSLGGLTARHQQIALVNRTHWYGDGRSSGLLGLAYPYMTGADGSTRAYDPIFTTLWKENATDPVFTLALSRYEPTGGGASPGASSAGDAAAAANTSYIAFGGVPPTVQYDDATWARTPIEPLAELRSWSFAPSTSRGLYVITPTAWVYSRRARNGSVSTTSSAATAPASVDAGSTLTVLPADVADNILSSFDPPPHWVVSGGAYYAPCNARVPTFGMQIGTQVFYMEAADLLRQNERDVETGRFCRVGITDGEAAPYTLGVTFLTNVIAVFDIGNGEMRFASRTQY